MDDLLEDREDNVEDVEAVDPFAASGLNLPGLKGPGLLGTLDRYQKQKMQKLCFAKIRICTAWHRVWFCEVTKLKTWLHNFPNAKTMLSRTWI